MSRSAVFHRVKRLERDGVIKGYCARLDRSKLGLEIRAFCNVSLQQHAAGFLEEFEAAIANFREVRSCFTLQVPLTTCSRCKWWTWLVPHLYSRLPRSPQKHR